MLNEPPVPAGLSEVFANRVPGSGGHRPERCGPTCGSASRLPGDSKEASGRPHSRGAVGPAPATLTLGSRASLRGRRPFPFRERCRLPQARGGDAAMSLEPQVTSRWSPQPRSSAGMPRQKGLLRGGRSPGHRCLTQKTEGRRTAGNTAPCLWLWEPLRATSSRTGTPVPLCGLPLCRTHLPDVGDGPQASGCDTGLAVSLCARVTASCHSDPCVAPEGYANGEALDRGAGPCRADRRGQPRHKPPTDGTACPRPPFPGSQKRPSAGPGAR